ncbi:MAG: PpiC-type peptidyl-prolyl cis-trans isomerase [candidate division NC10 bacterium]|nr:PpiC-type peptidyl-prolyl cis-trans isomerase [candidate division NC10 bacterium]
MRAGGMRSALPRVDEGPGLSGVFRVGAAGAHRGGFVHGEESETIMRMAMRVVVSLLAVGMWAAAAHAAVTEEAGKGPRVVATVNKTDLTYDDFKVRLQLLEQERGPVPPERYGEILRALVREEILYQAAVEQHLDEDASVKQRAEVARRQVIVEELLRRKVEAGSQVSDEEARKAYQENQSLFSAETVGVSHIMVKSESDAEAVQAELKAGKAFADVAKAKSQDQGSAEKGGDLGTVGRGQTEPEFDAAAFALKDGEVSGIVKTQYGYHILKGGPHTTTVQPFEDVKDKLREMLAKQKQRDVLMMTMKDLEQRAATQLFEDRLR